MPVSSVMNGGNGTPGFTNVSSRPSSSPPRQLQRADLGDAVGRRRPAGGLEVEDDERDLRERGREVVERRAIHRGSVSEQAFATHRCSACGRARTIERMGDQAHGRPVPLCGVRQPHPIRRRCARRTRAFHHYSIGGELQIEEEEVLEDRVERVSCRWCGASGSSIERTAIESSDVRCRAAGRPGVVSAVGRRSRCRRSSATCRHRARRW